MTLVKICGLTREEDVAAASELGAAMLGFNFSVGSSRRISPRHAAAIAGASGSAARVGVFVEAPRDEIARAVAEAGLSVVQLHRAVVAADCEAIPAALMAAVRLESGREGLPPPGVLERCRALLWDSSAGRAKEPDWTLLERVGPLPVPVFVAGGLTADNVGGVIRRLRPAGVDVASGVESAPGVKDRRKLEEFFAAVREADRGQT